jgi:hypothetical protein
MQSSITKSAFGTGVALILITPPRGCAFAQATA